MARVGGRTLRNGVLLGTIVASAACGSSFSSTTPDLSLLDPEQPRSPTSTVTITSAGLDPVVLHRDHPVTALFVNNDTAPHTLASAPDLGWDDCPEMRDLPAIKPGKQLAVTFSENDAVCAYHDVAQPGSVPFQGYVAIH